MKIRKTSSPFTEAVAAPGPPLIGALLRMPWEAVRQRMLDRLHERGFDDLDAPHLTVFQYPGPQGARPSELAVRLRVSKQALNYLLRELERLGYLKRSADPHDRRSRRVTLTRRGESVVQTMREAVGEIEREWEERLGPRRFAELRSLLSKLGVSG
ncbi:MAG: MarR family transcriptional regulator [bacterium]